MPFHLGLATLNLGMLALRRGRLTDTRRWLSDASRLWRSLGVVPYVQVATCGLAACSLREGDRAAARWWAAQSAWNPLHAQYWAELEGSGVLTEQTPLLVDRRSDLPTSRPTADLSGDEALG